MKSNSPEYLQLLDSFEKQAADNKQRRREEESLQEFRDILIEATHPGLQKQAVWGDVQNAISDGWKSFRDSQVLSTAKSYAGDALQGAGKLWDANKDNPAALAGVGALGGAGLGLAGTALLAPKGRKKYMRGALLGGLIGGSVGGAAGLANQSNLSGNSLSERKATADAALANARDMNKAWDQLTGGSATQPFAPLAATEKLTGLPVGGDNSIVVGETLATTVPLVGATAIADRWASRVDKGQIADAFGRGMAKHDALNAIIDVAANEHAADFAVQNKGKVISPEDLNNWKTKAKLDVIENLRSSEPSDFSFGPKKTAIPRSVIESVIEDGLNSTATSGTKLHPERPWWRQGFGTTHQGRVNTKNPFAAIPRGVAYTVPSALRFTGSAINNAYNKANKQFNSMWADKLLDAVEEAKDKFQSADPNAKQEAVKSLMSVIRSADAPDRSLRDPTLWLKLMTHHLQPTQENMKNYAEKGLSGIRITDEMQSQAQELQEIVNKLYPNSNVLLR